MLAFRQSLEMDEVYKKCSSDGLGYQKAVLGTLADIRADSKYI